MRSIRRRFSAILSVAAAVAALSCSGGEKSAATLSQSAPGAPTQHKQFALPAPSFMLDADPQRSLSYVQGDLHKEGSGYEQNIPSSNVTGSNNIATYSPSFTGSPGDLSGLAWAVYKFQAEGFDRAPRLALEWSDSEPEPPAVWLGVSRWDSDNWHFAAFNGEWRADFGEIEPYFNENDILLAAVIVTGSDSGQLKGLQLGGQPPLGQLELSPDSGPAPLDVVLDASLSQAGEGSIVQHEWDFDGDGSYDQSSGVDSVVEHSYAELGEFQPRLRLTNSLGLQAVVLGGSIKVNDLWQRSYGRADADYSGELALDSAGNIYSCGISYEQTPDDSVSRASLTKFSPAGQILWSRFFRADGHTSFISCALDSNGDLLVAGSEGGTGGDSARELLQKWSPAGELLWTRYLERVKPIHIDKLLCVGTEIYIGGYTTENTGGSYDFYAAAVDGSGALLWDKVYSMPGGQYSYGAAILSSDFTGPFGFVSVGHGAGSTDVRPLRMDIALDGSLLAAAELSVPGSSDLVMFADTVQYYDDFFADPVYYICGTYRAGNQPAVFALKIGASGNSIAGTVIRGPDYISGSCFDGSGQLSVGGRRYTGSELGWLGNLRLSDMVLTDSRDLIAGEYGGGIRSLLSLPGRLIYSGEGQGAEGFLLDYNAETQELSASWNSVTPQVTDAQSIVWQNQGEAGDLLPLVVLDEGAGYEDVLVGKMALLD